MQTQQQQIELSIEEAREIIEMQDALLKLEKNRAFKKVILDGFFDSELKRMAVHLGSPSEQMAKGASNTCIGVGALQTFFNAIHRKGESMRAQLVELEEMERQARVAGE